MITYLGMHRLISSVWRISLALAWGSFGDWSGAALMTICSSLMRSSPSLEPLGPLLQFHGILVQANLHKQLADIIICWNPIFPMLPSVSPYNEPGSIDCWRSMIATMYMYTHDDGLGLGGHNICTTIDMDRFDKSRQPVSGLSPFAVIVIIDIQCSIALHPLQAQSASLKHASEPVPQMLSVIFVQLCQSELPIKCIRARLSPEEAH